MIPKKKFAQLTKLFIISIKPVKYKTCFSVIFECCSKKTIQQSSLTLLGERL